MNDFFEDALNPTNIFGAIRCQGYSNIVNRNCIVSGPSRRMGGELYFVYNLFTIYLKFILR